MKLRWKVCLSMVLTMLGGCWLKNDSLAGGTSTETEALVLGTFLNPDGSQAVGASVRIRPIEFLSQSNPMPKNQVDLIADAKGQIHWDTKDTGLYNLEVIAGTKLGTLIRNVSPGKESHNLRAMLDTVGSLRLNLLFPVLGNVYTLRVFGVERAIVADSQGSFRVTLPAGEYRLIITGTPGLITPLVINRAVVERGREVLLDSLRFPKLDSALISYWPFEEGAGEIVGDGSGNKYVGNLKGATWVQGKIGGAIQFTKGQGYVDFGIPSPDAFAFGPVRDFTFAAWIKLGNPIPNRGFARRIISKQKNSDYAFFLRVFPDGYPGFAANGGNPVAKESSVSNVGVGDLRAPISVADANWHHLAALRKLGRLWIYVDGKEWASARRDSLKTDGSFIDYNDHSPLLYPDPGLDGHLVIGCVESGIDGFDGIIDEVRIYDRGLTPQEIQQLAHPFSN
jgi:hypothetical protein